MPQKERNDVMAEEYDMHPFKRLGLFLIIILSLTTYLLVQVIGTILTGFVTAGCVEVMETTPLVATIANEVVWSWTVG